MLPFKKQFVMIQTVNMILKTIEQLSLKVLSKSKMLAEEITGFHSKQNYFCGNRDYSLSFPLFTGVVRRCVLIC